MKKIIICSLILCLVPLSCFASERIWISESAGYLEIPDGFTEIVSDVEGQRNFVNSSLECVQIAVIYLKDIYPYLYELQIKQGKRNEPLYRNGGELSGVISEFVEIYNDMGTWSEISITNIGECAAVKGESETATMLSSINRYEVVTVVATHNNIYSQNRFIPTSFYPLEQPLHADPLEE